MLREVKKYLKPLLKVIFPPWYRTKDTAAPIKPLGWLMYKLKLTDIYWPVHKTSVVSGAKNIKIGIGTAPGLSPGCYIFADRSAPIVIGDYTIVAPNVIIAGYNHDLFDYRKKGSKKGIHIGKYCWIAANASIMPGVKLGNHVIVAANSVVTKSYVEGYCVIGGNPAKIIKKLDRGSCISFENKYKYLGYVRLNDK